MPTVLTATGEHTALVTVTSAPLLVHSFSADAVFRDHLVDARAHSQGPTSLPATGGTITTPCNTSSFFAVTLTQASTQLADPTGPTADGQKVMWQITQGSGGNKALTYGSKFRFSYDIPEPILSTVAGAVDYLGAMYVADLDVWRVIAFVRGF